MLQLQSEPAKGTIAISGRLTQQYVMSVWLQAEQELVTTCKLHNQIQINLRDVEQVDTAGLAALLELSRLATRQQVKLVCTNTSSSLQKLANLSDLDGILTLQ